MRRKVIKDGTIIKIGRLGISFWWFSFPSSAGYMKQDKSFWIDIGRLALNIYIKAK